MSFYKKNYVETQRKRNTMIALASVVVIIIIVFSFNLLKKSPPEETGPGPGTVTAEKIPGEKPETVSPASKEKDMPTIIKETRHSVVLVNILDRSGNIISVGSGFIIDENGDIISNRHVFKGVHQAEVHTTKGKFTVATVQAQDADNDLVRVSLGRTGHKFKPLKMSDSMPEVGESIVVIGNPLGLEATVSNGIVSAKRKFPPFGEVIQITCPISPGSSGSPVLNMRGEVIGVATFQMVKGQNLNFAIPIAYARALKPSKGEELASLNIETSEFIESLDNPFDQGLMLFDREQYEGAILYFKQAVEKDPQNAEAYFHLGICYRETRTTDSIEAFKKAIEIKPDYAEAYCELGITYNLLNMKQEAIDAFRSCLKITPDSEKALLNLGIAYCLDEKFKAASQVLERSVEIYPDKKAYYFLGLSYGELKKHQKAIQAFKSCIEIDPEYVEAYIGLGASYGAVESWSMGIRALNQAVILDPQNPQVHFILGMLHLGNHDLDSAEREYILLQASKGDENIRRELGNQLGSAISRFKSGQRRRY